MAAPVKNSATSIVQVVIDWASVTTSPANGGTAITSYSLYWDAGTGGSSYVNLVGDLGAYTLTTYTITTGITAGQSYKFKVRVQNTWGWSVFSTVTTIIASTAPS